MPHDAPAFDARVELPDRIEHIEAAPFASRRLTLRMTGWVAARQLAVARFVVSLEHERGRAAIPATELEIAPGEPTWHEEHLAQLLKERLSRIELAAPIIALWLEAKDVREAEVPSDSLFPEPGGSPQDHARLMELLTARAGSVNIIVWQSVLEKFHRKALGSSLLAVYGVWQREGEARHLVANRLVDVSSLLGELPTVGRNFC
jgi:hypothetical protein